MNPGIFIVAVSGLICVIATIIILCEGYADKRREEKARVKELRNKARMATNEESDFQAIMTGEPEDETKDANF